MFAQMLDDEYAKKMASAGGIGISDMIFEQFERYVEKDKPSLDLKG